MSEQDIYTSVPSTRAGAPSGPSPRSGSLGTIIARIEEAIDLARHLDPDLLIDGPMQGNTALDPEAMAEYPFMAFDEPANVLICPNLAAANIAYKLLENLADVEMIGPILEGLNRPVQVVARTDGVRHIANMAAICALDSLRRGD